MEAGDFYGVPGATGAAFDPTTGQLLATPDPVALKLQTYFPAATAAGWACGMPRSGERIGKHSSNLPHHFGPNAGQQLLTNNFMFNGSSPNTDTWYTGKADYDHLRQTKTFV